MFRIHSPRRLKSCLRIITLILAMGLAAWELITLLITRRSSAPNDKTQLSLNTRQSHKCLIKRRSSRYLTRHTSITARLLDQRISHQIIHTDLRAHQLNETPRFDLLLKVGALSKKSTLLGPI
ncbi:unnamed protein product [Oikopleura dioica]|uniref:Uncharacterized protein n=1 Tax=Oikopleura dioica TaxID=34765 RepID=E4YCD7_OIKDI|nr:unnamed protein product [Oikopleura dioica]